MINPENSLGKDLEKIRFALFANGANFSCRVLKHLLKINFSPDLIVLPDYPAAQEQSDSALNFKSKSYTNPIIAISDDIPIEYAPRKEQAVLIPVLLKQSFDYLLVACWPYLIDNEITQTALKAALNLHPSLLPHYRGPDPVEMQLAENENNHGVSLHLLSQCFDQGDIVSQARIDTIDNHDRLSIENHCAITGVELFIKAAREFDQGWNLVKQPD